MLKRYLFIFFLVIQLLVTLGIGIALSYAQNYNLAAYGTKAGNLDLEGYTKEDAWELIKSIIPQEVQYKEQVYSLSTVESQKHIESWLQEQYQYYGSSNTEKIVEYINKCKEEKVISDLLLEEEIIPQLGKIKEAIDRSGLAAHFIEKQGQLIIKEEEPGYELDIEESWQKLRQSYTNQPVQLIVRTVDVSPKKEDLALVKDVLGSYMTFYDPSNINKTHNIRLAAETLNNTLVAPEEIFSFNDVIGERTEERGYKKARTYLDDQIVIDQGGGICQNSSTLYQAVLRANLSVIEKHSHTLPVGYVPLGGDATVSYGKADFRFKNNTKGYILIRAKAENNWLKIQIIGCADEDHPVEEYEESYQPVYSSPKDK